MFLVIDFETYYDKEYSLAKLTIQEYIDDSRFEVIGVGVNDTWVTENIQNFLDSLSWDTCVVVAHNAIFDISILTWRYNIKPKYIVDTLSMARAIHGVGQCSLAALAEKYNLGKKGIEVTNALGKRKQDFTQEELEAYGSYCKKDIIITRALVDKLLPSFSFNELSLIDMTVRMHSEPQFMLDKELLQTYLLDIKTHKKALLEQAGVTVEKLASNNKFAELLKTQGVEPPTKLSLTTGKSTYAFAKTDPELQALLEHSNLAVQALVAARLGIKSTLEESRVERLLSIANKRDRLPVPLNYYAAHTGRWGGTGAINMQNLPRGSTLRSCIVAPPRSRIVGCDLSNIELRMGLWLAGQYDALQLLAAGCDLYRTFAAFVFDTPYDVVTTEQRFVGKVAQLQLIYGSGPAALVKSAKIDVQLADRIVQQYREQYKAVKKAWYEAENILKSINTDTNFDYKSLKVYGNRGVQLPSGLFMTYKDLYNTEEGWFYKDNKMIKKIYGAKVFQNIVQALARCVMSEAMVRINQKYHVALTIHDAVYVLADDQNVEEVKEYVVSEMTKEPHWAPGIPLAAEAYDGGSLK